MLVTLLVGRGGSDDVEQARDIVAEFEANLPAVPDPSVQLWLLQCRALLASAVCDAVSYSEVVTRYRELAERLDARGHLAVAKQFAAEPDFGP